MNWMPTGPGQKSTSRPSTARPKPTGTKTRREARVAAMPTLSASSPVIGRGKSRQKKHGGGKFKSEKQRGYLWKFHPGAAKKWAHNKKTRKSDWR